MNKAEREQKKDGAESVKVELSACVLTLIVAAKRNVFPVDACLTFRIFAESKIFITACRKSLPFGRHFRANDIK